jgi:hypothetical protein
MDKRQRAEKRQREIQKAVRELRRAQSVLPPPATDTPLINKPALPSKILPATSSPGKPMLQAWSVASMPALLESPYTALVCAVVLGALALSGRFSVSATQFLLVAAWGIVIVGMRGQQLTVTVGVAAIVGGILLLLAYYFRPDAVPSYAGILTPKGETLFSSSSKIMTRSIEIGNSGLQFGQMNFYGTPLLVELVEGKAKVSSEIRAENGDIIATISRNEWQVIASAWDRNYNDYALEVKNQKGRVVLQVKVLADRIQIQGEWWSTDGHGVRVLQTPQGGINMIAMTPGSVPEEPAIQPIFLYPSALHFGELKQ